MTHEYLHTDIRPPLAVITLHRPEVRNAFHIGMIRELISSFHELESDPLIHLVRLTATGPHFSAGADLNWLREGLEQRREQLISESLELADLFRTLRTSRLIIVTSVRGRAMGGAVGLVAASDIVVAEESSSFAFSEVKLGLVPATIAPYVIRKMGYSRGNELMLSGRTFSADEALRWGLVHHLCPGERLEEATGAVLEQLSSNGPLAMGSVKALLEQLAVESDPEQVRELTASLIAQHRISQEGQEGMKAFLDKRDPSWHEKK
jgi:methylglutaconyl-CoA hydratase